MTPSYIELAADSVLGTLLHHYTPQSIVRVQAQRIKVEDFGPEGCRQRAMYKAILRLHKDGAHVDPVTVEAFLHDYGWFERAGGRAYMELLYVSANPGALTDHARIVAREGSRLRSIAYLEQAHRCELVGDRDAVAAAIASWQQEQHPAGLRVVDGGKEQAA